MESSLVVFNESALTFGGETDNEIVRVGTEWLEGKNSVNTRDSYDFVIKQFIIFLELVYNLSYTPNIWKEVKGIHIIAFKRYLEKIGYKKRKTDTRDTPYAKRSINHHISSLSSFFDELIEKQLLAYNPARIERFKINEREVVSIVLDDKEARAMLDAPQIFNDCKEPRLHPISEQQILRDSLIMHVFFFRGCRISELCNLRVGDYFKDKGYPVLEVTLKGGRTSRLAINQQLCTVLDQYLDENGHANNPQNPLILPLRDNQEVKDDQLRHLRRLSVSRIWDKYARFVGLEKTTPHSARATFATSAIENDCPLQDVQEALGHNRIETTRTYVKSSAKYHESPSFRLHY